MIVPEAFQAQLRAVDSTTFARWEYWKDEGDGETTVQPWWTAAFRVPTDALPTSGRMVVRSGSKRYGTFVLFDVLHPDLTPHPLDRRVVDRVAARVEIHDKLDDSFDDMNKQKRKDNRLQGKAEGEVVDGLEQAFRSGTGLKQYGYNETTTTLPDSPGIKITDRRRFH